ncbi:MAG: hypothetical protein OJI70_11815 [Zavarzinia sp.]|nr:hypothetical protein [Zavarzinia sp.]
MTNPRSSKLGTAIVTGAASGIGTVYADRHGETSPPYPHLADRLKAGDEMPLDEFPVIA